MPARSPLAKPPNAGLRHKKPREGNGGRNLRAAQTEGER